MTSEAALDSLLAPPPTERADLAMRDRLHRQLEDDLAEYSDLLEAWSFDDLLKVSKRKLAAVHTCEEHFLLPSDFEWTLATVRGRLAHQAVRFGLCDPDLESNEVARSCIAAAIAEDEDEDVRALLASLTPPTLRDLEQYVANVVHDIRSALAGIALPSPIRSEHRVGARVASAVWLSGKVDLSLGMPRSGCSGTVLIELKTGSPSLAEQRR